MSLNYALTHQLVGWDGQRSYAAMCAVALVVNVALNARVIPAWGIDGAAWATLVCQLAAAVVLVNDTRRLNDTADAHSLLVGS